MGPLFAHNETALRDILLRTNAEDHPALRCVCRQFRAILEADDFRRDRMIAEYAQVKAHLQTPQELLNQLRRDHPDENYPIKEEFFPLGQVYDGESDLLTNNVRITVDGNEAGSAEVSFVRCGTSHFYDLCDMHSQDLGAVGTLFFNETGGPTAFASVKENCVGSTGYFVYIRTFSLHKEYRQHTWVGAQALRDFLTRDPLRGKWRICIYVADVKGQTITQDDDKAVWELNHMNRDRIFRDVPGDGTSTDQIDMKRHQEQFEKTPEETSQDDEKLGDQVNKSCAINSESVMDDTLFEQQALDQILEIFAQNSAVEVLQGLNEQFDDALSTIDQLQRHLVEDGSPETEERRRELTFSRLNVERGRQEAIEETRYLCRETVQKSFDESEEFRNSVNELARSLALENMERDVTEQN
eukprot:scaffold5364_cov164-Amphora_coffeaeformis.AAC.1